METPCVVRLLSFFLTQVLIEPSDSKIATWYSDLNDNYTYPPESFDNLREYSDEFYGWDRLAEVNGWTNIPNNSSSNGTGLEAVDNPLDCSLRFEMNSCFNSCGVFRVIFCSCDEFCHIYHSCCNDYEKYCRIESERSLTRYRKFNGIAIECIALDVAYYVISGCPETANVTLSKKCRESKAEPYSVLHTGLHFKNIFCWQCFNLDDLVEKWKISVGINRRGKRSTVNLRRLFQNEITFSWRFASMHLIRQCVPGAIDRCPKNTPTKLRRLCEYAQRPFKLQYEGNTNLELYINAFCADCNTRLFKNISHCSYLGYEYFKTSNSNQFSILLTIDAPDNIIVTTSVSPFSWSKIKCRSMVEDVPTDCEIVDCKDKYKFVNGECLKKKIKFSDCFLLNFLIKKPADDLIFDKFVNAILLVSGDFLQGINFTFKNYTLDSISSFASGNIRIILRYDLERKWTPDINVFNSYVDHVERKKRIFDMKGDLDICTSPPDYAYCLNSDCFLLYNTTYTKTIRLDDDMEINIATARLCASYHNTFMIIFVMVIFD